MRHKIGWIFVFVLIAFLFSFPNRAGAEDRFREIAEIQVDYGINGYFRADSILLLNFKFRNVKKDFFGKIEIRFFSDNEAPCSLIKELRLYKGKNEEVCFYLYLNSYEPGFSMRILDGSGKKLWKKESVIDLFETDVHSDIVIGEVDGAGSGHHFKGESVLNIKKRGLRSESFPLSYLGLHPFDILIIPDGYLKGKNTEVIKILEERIRKGGLVVEEKNIRQIDLYKTLLMKEDRDEWMWRVEKVIGFILRDLTVKGGRYVLVLVIYILMVSPFTYYVLYRKKKRNLYYLAVPLISILFTIIMYAVGSDSRISGLRINHISVLDLRKNRSFENTIFAITNSTNRSYDVSVRDDYKVEPAFGLYAAPDRADPMDGKVKRQVVEKKNRTDITIGEGTAFETVYFRAEGNPEVHFEDMGKLYREQNEIKGEFQNRLGMSLDHVFAIFDDEILHLGKVEDGEKKEIRRGEVEVFLSDYTGKIAESLFMREIFKDRENHDELSKEMLMSMLIEKLSLRKYDKPLFLAISEGKLGNGFANKINAEDGYSIFMLSAETKSEEKENQFVNSINKLQYRIEGEEDSFLYNTFPNKSSSTVTYQLPSNSYSKLSYFRRYNHFVNFFSIALKNVETGKFDTIFFPDADYLEEIRAYANGKRNNIKDAREEDDRSFVGLGRYIKDGEITVRYEIETSVHEKILAYFSPQIPKLSLE